MQTGGKVAGLQRCPLRLFQGVLVPGPLGGSTSFWRWKSFEKKTAKTHGIRYHWNSHRLDSQNSMICTQISILRHSHAFCTKPQGPLCWERASIQASKHSLQVKSSKQFQNVVFPSTSPLQEPLQKPYTILYLIIHFYEL